jgi:periplasmic protein TonB
MGGNVMGPLLTKRVQPIYPLGALSAHRVPVVVHAIIGTDGVRKELTIVSGDPDLAKAALEAVRQWRYRPTLMNGMPVEVDTSIAVISDPLT